tara:strand:+ start:407 stop:619 length:213 start_codon:yes stop_codon:yes gene_type:complete
MARGDGTSVVMSDPENRANTMQTKYAVNATGDRWFIPYNNAGSTADQLAQCKKAVGSTADDSDAGAETVV